MDFKEKITVNEGILFFEKDLPHREDGPAITFEDGTQIWYEHGKFHRLDGPAIIYSTGEKKWFVNGQQYFEKEFLKITKLKILW